MLHFSQFLNKCSASEKQPHFGKEEPSSQFISPVNQSNQGQQNSEIAPQNPHPAEKSLTRIKRLIARVKKLPETLKKHPQSNESSTASNPALNSMMRPTSSTKIGKPVPLKRPQLFEELFSSPVPRGIWRKKLPKFTITPEEVRLSKSAGRQAIIDQGVLNTPWNESLFMPYPEEVEEEAE